MDTFALRSMADSELTHWWWEGRRTILGSVLEDLYARGGMPKGALYDLGCGVGSNLDVLGRFGPAQGFDGSELTVQVARERGRTNVHFEDLSRGERALEQLPSESAAVVLFADVLEHLDDEQSALALADRLLVPGGVLLVTVPAFMWLWGPADVVNHHRRRYTRASLERVVERRFTLERLTYFNSLLLAPIAGARLLQRVFRRGGEDELGVPSAPVNRVLRAVFSSEAGLLRKMSFPAGVSLLCVARKPERRG